MRTSWSGCVVCTVGLVGLAAIVVAGLGLGAAAADGSNEPAAERPSAAKRLDDWRRSRSQVYMNDFGELARYRQANLRLSGKVIGKGAAVEGRVVFFGDSITDLWRLERFFPGKPYVNRGIGGQTTAQMLLRFRQDVIELGPAVVVILAGTNDIAGNTGPMTLAEIEGNLLSMVELARAHGIRVVLSSVLPVHDYTPASEMAFPLRPPEKILELNRWLKATCASAGLVYLDYFAAMVDDKGLLTRRLADDGLHPNLAGYGLMAPLAEAAIGQAMGMNAGAAAPSGGSKKK